MKLKIVYSSWHTTGFVDELKHLFRDISRNAKFVE
jgi:hypothetical protein